MAKAKKTAKAKKGTAKAAKPTAKAAKPTAKFGAKAAVKTSARRILSAAVKLGGKMSTETVRLPITNVYMDGDYTGTIYVGSLQKPCNVILDTGSSTLAVDSKVYDPTKDKVAKITDIAQEVGYADGSSWIGAVVTTDVIAGAGTDSVTLEQVDVAVAYHETSSMFRGADGILGLAYTKLNNAFVMPGRRFRRRTAITRFRRVR